MAIQKANERKATVQGTCKLLKNFLDAEAKFIKEPRGQQPGPSVRKRQRCFPTSCWPLTPRAVPRRNQNRVV
jgi:hypothetical protein